MSFDERGRTGDGGGEGTGRKMWSKQKEAGSARICSLWGLLRNGGMRQAVLQCKRVKK